MGGMYATSASYLTSVSSSDGASRVVDFALNSSLSW